MREAALASGAVQTPEMLARVVEEYLAQFPGAVVLEDGRVLFDLRMAKCTVTAEHGRCTLHLWGSERNLVRSVVGAVVRGGALRLATRRFGQAKSQTLEIQGENERRTPSAREVMRERYVRVLERALERRFEGWKVEGMRTAMDLEKSFGPAYARGLLVQGNRSWAVIGVNEEEMQATVDGILTVGILWLELCRRKGDGRRVVSGLRVVVPAGLGGLTASRMVWLNERMGGWEVWELDRREDVLEQRDAADHGNVQTRLIHAPHEAMARERFRESTERVLGLVPPGRQKDVEQRVRSGAEIGFLLHGLEFARIRMRTGENFNRTEEITFGTQETGLTAENEGVIRAYVGGLFQRRGPGGSVRDPLYRMQPERWLEGVLRREMGVVDRGLEGAEVYGQVPAFAGGDRGMMDLLSVTEDGRLAVVEVKADEDLHLALQGLDYWVRVRWHHRQSVDVGTGLGEFQRHGYFAGRRLAAEDPRLYLVAPALRVHPAVETVLRYFSPEVEWALVAVDERWRNGVKVVWRKSSAVPPDGPTTRGAGTSHRLV